MFDQFLNNEYHINSDGSGMCKTIVCTLQSKMIALWIYIPTFHRINLLYAIAKGDLLAAFDDPDVYDFLNVCQPFLSSLFGDSRLILSLSLSLCTFFAAAETMTCIWIFFTSWPRWQNSLLELQNILYSMSSFSFFQSLFLVAIRKWLLFLVLYWEKKKVAVSCYLGPCPLLR